MRTKLIGNKLVVVETAQDAIAALEESEFDIAALDHDLGGEEMVESGPGTGYEVACWLEQHPDRQPNIIWIHTLNPVGRQRMAEALPKAEIRPLWWNVE